MIKSKLSRVRRLWSNHVLECDKCFNRVMIAQKMTLAERISRFNLLLSRRDGDERTSLRNYLLLTH